MRWIATAEEKQKIPIVNNLYYENPADVKGIVTKNKYRTFNIQMVQLKATLTDIARNDTKYLHHKTLLHLTLLAVVRYDSFIVDYR